ncbi:uncharacterized protein DUF3500 [Dyadobacter jejuensis]|uniref:Uncharacterized protein DUF3500 n=1 Tax=Dyadobacter jejuensis TaxID=1082580 RepID=A0A316AP23_9BACT|nr:DUF3500 domain-containing protein [Dyadobacter jejuensis]PWJ59535.1 uncharacterized protein DUF3500 [Dyadobacter jejuensis]
MNKYIPRIAWWAIMCFLLPVPASQAQQSPADQQALTLQMQQKAQDFMTSLGDEGRNKALFPFDDAQRFDWHFVPRDRKGLPLKEMTDLQREKAMALVRTMLSTEGLLKVQQIMDLENVLRVVESRPPNDLRRDPDNYSFIIFGEPGAEPGAAPWGWRVEGHHLSLHFSFYKGQISFTPGFMGSNPGTVLADVPQKNRNVLRQEQMFAFELLGMLSEEQRKKSILSDKAPYDILTGNSRKALLENFEGISYQELDATQRKKFEGLIQVYLNRYPITLASHRWEQLRSQGLEHIYFAWMGDLAPAMGPGHGHYYRIHGPGFLIEFDNTQNDANHIHTVVRDLDNDFGEDMLGLHYQQDHPKK